MDEEKKKSKSKSKDKDTVSEETPEPVKEDPKPVKQLKGIHIDEFISNFREMRPFGSGAEAAFRVWCKALGPEKCPYRQSKESWKALWKQYIEAAPK